MNASVIMPSKRTGDATIAHDPAIYEWRSPIARHFSRLMHDGRFAARYARRTNQSTGFVISQPHDLAALNVKRSWPGEAHAISDRVPGACDRPCERG